MSDTPRTDAFITEQREADGRDYAFKYEKALLFARQLERELNNGASESHQRLASGVAQASPGPALIDGDLFNELAEVCRAYGWTDLARRLNAAPQASTGNGQLQDRLGNAGVPGPAAAAPQVRLNDDKTLDEVVATGANVQLEKMDYNHWFLQIGDVAVWLHAKGKITATYEIQHF